MLVGCDAAHARPRHLVVHASDSGISLGNAGGDVCGTADVISGTGLNFLKLHHLHVVQNTAMASEYHAHPFPLLGLDDYADLVVDFLERLSPEIYVERLFGTAPKDQLIGPVWGKSKAEIQRTIEQGLASRNTWQGRKAVVSTDD